MISEVSAICFAKVSSIRIPSLRSTVAMIRGSSTLPGQSPAGDRAQATISAGLWAG